MAALLLGGRALPAQRGAEPPRGAAALAQLVDGLGQTARVLVVGAHPDDEDTRLIAWLARGRHVETAYLSLTRGDGGQNLIGNELGEALGAVRTEELLAARRLDGGRQYFARAFDFGFSKSADETFRHWPRDTVLGDVVRVVRAFRPHVIIAIFSGTPADGHGHHQASGILAREAYDLATDTVRFPAAEYNAPWPVAKFYRNTSYRGAETATLRYDAGAYDPLLGRSYAELAAISRTQHKSQGQGGPERLGPSIVSMRREATRVNADTPADREQDLLDGVDTRWAQLARTVRDPRARAVVDSLDGAAAAVRAAFDARDPRTLVAPLQRMRALLAAACPPAPENECERIDRRDGRLHRTLRNSALAWAIDGASARVTAAMPLAAGVAIEAIAEREVTAPGEPLRVVVSTYNRGRDTLSFGAPLVDGDPNRPRISTARYLRPGEVRRDTVEARLTDVTAPAWLAQGRRGDLFVAPLRPYAGPGEPNAGLSYGPLGPDVWGSVLAPLVYRVIDPVHGQIDRPVAVEPAVTVTLDRAVQYARAGAPLDRVVRVSVRSASTQSRSATVRLELPAGLTADSAARTITLDGQRTATVAFRVRGALAPGRHLVRAAAESNGERFTAGYQLVDYPHIRPQRLYRAAELAIEAVDVALPPRAAVAYLPGVSDNVAPTLADLGLAVTVVDPATVGGADLSRFTHVVVGPRAYEAHPELRAANARLLDWVRAGGTMVVQYGQYEMTAPGVMPYPITLARPARRVTIEEAPVAVVDAGARVLAAPNRLGEADWRGWVQERAIYMPQTADPRYRPAIAIADPGEPPNPNAVLVAAVGRGTYVYTTLALFRQLPAGVPGAARLMANLLAARAAPAPAAAAAGGR